MNLAELRARRRHPRLRDQRRHPRRARPRPLRRRHRRRPRLRRRDRRARRAGRLADPAAGERIRARSCGGHVRRTARSYALAITTGLPVLHPDPEPVDGLALATKAIEAAGLLAARACSGDPDRRDPPTTERNTDMNTRTYRPLPLALTMLIALFSALVALAVAGGHDAAAHGNGDQQRRRTRPPLTTRRGSQAVSSLSARRCAGSGKTTSPGRAWRSSA